MANIKSAQKRAVQSEERRGRNASLRSRMRTAVKRVRKAIEAGDKAQARVVLGEVASVIDSTATKGIVHPNAASRYKSRLSAAVKAMA
jgi:small subunit ribosomal protein S20